MYHTISYRTVPCFSRLSLPICLLSWRYRDFIVKADCRTTSSYKHVTVRTGNDRHNTVLFRDKNMIPVHLRQPPNVQSSDVLLVLWVVGHPTTKLMPSYEPEKSCTLLFNIYYGSDGCWALMLLFPVVPPEHAVALCASTLHVCCVDPIT